VHDPPVLILDEPTSGLDPIVSRTVEEAVKSLAAAGKCVLFSTHLLAQAEDICHRIGVIGQGRVLAEGTIPELCDVTGAKNLRQAFFKLVDQASIDVEVAPLKAFPVVHTASATSSVGSASAGGLRPDCASPSPEADSTAGRPTATHGGDHAI
jgi:ABC-type multidrug transport system ATPase subunit